MEDLRPEPSLPLPLAAGVAGEAMGDGCSCCLRRRDAAAAAASIFSSTLDIIFASSADSCSLARDSIEAALSVRAAARDAPGSVDRVEEFLQ